MAEPIPQVGQSISGSGYSADDHPPIEPPSSVPPLPAEDEPDFGGVVTAVVERAGVRTVPRQGRYTALVAVQNAPIRDAAIRILRALGATDVLGATSVAQARRAAIGRPGEVCVIEASLSDGSGISLARELRNAGWSRLIVLSSADEPGQGRAAVLAGVRCFLVSRSGSGAGGNLPATTLAGMSQRELEVLQLVADGHSNRDVGEQLGLSALTVKSHLARIARKLGTGDRAEMVVLAMRAGAIR